VKKPIRPRVFDASQPFQYAWSIPEGSSERNYAELLCRLAEKIYQFGRGVDLGWAWAELLDSAEFEKRLEAYTGTIHRPSGTGEGGQVLPCPTKGSLFSLQKRYAAKVERFEAVLSSRSFSESFRQEP